VQELQYAKLQLQLPAYLHKLDRYELLVLDDLGYVKKSEAETGVLFELIAHRYERKSLLITANQPFSQWDSIFTDSMMTVAAVDRLVHHATIFEIKTDSYRRICCYYSLEQFGCYLTAVFFAFVSTIYTCRLDPNFLLASPTRQ
jgi:DNA replication protein DnaC